MFIDTYKYINTYTHPHTQASTAENCCSKLRQVYIFVSLLGSNHMWIERQFIKDEVVYAYACSSNHEYQPNLWIFYGLVSIVLFLKLNRIYGLSLNSLHIFFVYVRTEYITNVNSAIFQTKLQSFMLEGLNLLCIACESNKLQFNWICVRRRKIEFVLHEVYWHAKTTISISFSSATFYNFILMDSSNENR